MSFVSPDKPIETMALLRGGRAWRCVVEAEDSEEEEEEQEEDAADPEKHWRSKFLFSLFIQF